MSARVLWFLSDAALVACGMTLALHGWMWTLLPIAIVVGLRYAADEVTS